MFDEKIAVSQKPLWDNLKVIYVISITNISGTKSFGRNKPFIQCFQDTGSMTD